MDGESAGQGWTAFRGGVRSPALRVRRTIEVRELEDPQRFERVVMPHLSAGYHLARWLTRNDHDAQDVVQEAYLRAVRSFDRYRGGDPRSWLLTIVRNTCYTWLRQNRAPEVAGALGKTDEAWGRSLLIPPGSRRCNSSAPPTGDCYRKRSNSCPRSSVKRWSCASWKGSLTKRSPTSPTFPSEP